MVGMKLKTERFEWQGKVYELRCNFNVLADIESEAGSIGAFLKMGTMKGVLIALAAMLNDYADSMGWEERTSSKELGRELSTSPGTIKQLSNMVVGLVLDAISAPAASEETEKN